MTRKLFPLFLVVGLVLPVPASAQQSRSLPRGGETGAGAVQAEIFMGALQEILRRHRSTFSDSTLWAAALDGLVESLDDPYAAVFTPAEVERFDEDNTGNYSGIGVQITQLNDRITITKVFRQTPADEAGLLEGDVIIGVDDKDASEWDTQMASDSIRGRSGTQVRLMVQRAGFSIAVPFTITRAQVHVPAVTAGFMDDTRVGYVALDRVARGSAQEVDSVLRELDGADGLIIDLRRNPGGFLDESLMISDVFLRPGAKLASLQSRAAGQSEATHEEAFPARSPARVPNVPIVILVDEYTASAAEIVTGALQDHDRALVLGQRTFGKGIVQSVLDLPHGHKLRITTGSWHTPLGRSLHRERDATGNPAAEDEAAFPRVRTASGRELVAGGGIFPDIEIPDDTLRSVERDFLEKSAEREIPLGMRLQEFAFEEAQWLRQSGRERPLIREESFQALVEQLRAEGVPGELLDDPQVREYLSWSARRAVADRLWDAGALASVLVERQPVLAEALRLLQDARTQEDLYAAARRVNGRANGAPSEPR